MPTRTHQRRRLAFLAVIAAGAGAAGIVAGQGEDERTSRARAAVAPVDGLTAVQRAGQLVVLRFAGTRAPGYVVRALRERRVAGVILFGDNVASRSQLRAMTRSLQRAAGGRALIMADQEGGIVRRVPWARPVAGQPALGSPGAARATARGAARDLRAAGVNVDLAPVADVAGPTPGSFMAERAFPGGAASVARLVGASVHGFDDGRVATAAKHFPGLGRSRTNTDFGTASISASKAALRARDLRPFRAAVAAGVPLVMASHALYPALDARRIASQSPTVLGGLLRGELGFRGVIVTDSLEARAVVRRSSTPRAAVRSVAAGADLALTSGPGSYLHVLRALVAEARRSPSFRARVRESAARVLELQRAYTP
jgi:beta-N-acetylhexosaminidase